MSRKIEINSRFFIPVFSQENRSSSSWHTLIFQSARQLSPWIFCLVLIAFCQPAKAADKRLLSREIWRGEMRQSAPMSWSGPMEFYFRYDSENNPPQPLDGLVIWPTLGQAKVKIKGTWKSEKNFEFKEEQCIDGDCSKVITGGQYIASLDSTGKILTGTAVGPMGLKGSFSAERYRPTTD